MAGIELIVAASKVTVITAPAPAPVMVWSVLALVGSVLVNIVFIVFVFMFFVLFLAIFVLVLEVLIFIPKVLVLLYASLVLFIEFPVLNVTTPALVIVHPQDWTEYGSLLELTDPFLDTPFLVVISTGAGEDASVAAEYPNRKVYHYYPDNPWVFFKQPITGP